jgi:hypothetical protein
MDKQIEEEWKNGQNTHCKKCEKYPEIDLIYTRD